MRLLPSPQVVSPLPLFHTHTHTAICLPYTPARRRKTLRQVVSTQGNGYVYGHKAVNFSAQLDLEHVSFPPSCHLQDLHVLS